VLLRPHQQTVLTAGKHGTWVQSLPIPTKNVSGNQLTQMLAASWDQPGGFNSKNAERPTIFFLNINSKDLTLFLFQL
jgi:hypothetical protein